MQTLVVFVLMAAMSFVTFAQTETEAKVISFKKLQEYLPTAAPDGFTRSKPTGTTANAMGYAVSEATVNFVKPEQDTIPEITLTAKIIDMSTMQYAALASVALVDFEQETETGYEKTVKIKSWRGIERVNHDAKSCELTLFSANRFVITLESSNTDELKPLYKLLDGIDIVKLEKLAAENSQ
ncbi:MAG: hypothetical protein OEM52_11440 [bacterium]|nr:hypothetical protein [bacterium]